MRGLIDVCLKKQADEIKETGTSWLTDDYIKGLMYDTVAAGEKNLRCTESPRRFLLKCISPRLPSSKFITSYNLNTSHS